MKKISFVNLTIFMFFIVAIICLIFNKNTKDKKFYVLEEQAFRTYKDIENAEWVYIDDEAIALSDASNTNTALRAEALKAYNYVNEERNAAGLSPLKWDSNLESTSSVRSQECSVSFSHTRPNGSAWYTVNSNIQGGENLAFGFNDAASATQAWMNSPTHRDNILYADFSKVAISVYETDDGTCYWAQEFGY